MSAPAVAGADGITGVGQELKRLLQQDELQIDAARILADETIVEIYRGNGYRPVWTRISDMRDLLELIEDSRDHGLNPADYSISQIRSILARAEGKQAGERTDERQAQDEILLTESLLRYGYHRRYGKVSANRLDPDINFRRDALSSEPAHVILQRIMAAPTLEGFIEYAAPSGPHYLRMQRWLEHYRKLAAAGGWAPVPEGPTLRRDDVDPRVGEIRRRLIATGDLGPGGDASPALFDADLEAAVKRFQARHGLADDGVVGKQSVAAMNVPVDVRVDQLRVSLERLRWVNQEAADTLVAVNIASFRVLFYRDGELQWWTRAMVGKNYRQTPVFRGDITYLEFNPTWTIPPGILRNDTLPAIKRDPNYLASKHIRVIDSNGQFVDPATVDWSRYRNGVPYTLRQDPGPWNALGTVKFIFPNPHFVFLHDTPHRELYDRPERAFSSGCIRVEDPLHLAELIFNEPGRYSKSTLQSIVDSRRTQRINLDEQIPVLILYLTAGVDPASGDVTFLKDIYDRDARVLAALDGPVVIDFPDFPRSGSE
ncbi:MAG: L,D-transpeptidase family protein [Gammaproteobacteria bacterium]|nr:L,D-transpeptidase family protein [Gammaproteobacteria bacterium]